MKRLLIGLLVSSAIGLYAEFEPSPCDAFKLAEYAAKVYESNRTPLENETVTLNDNSTYSPTL